ncbi:RdgC-like exonuclease [Shewanella sp. phage 1/4]|uniref:exonuclease recombination-associated n=1 Tax=Shewanella phage 1/4 TaxID=1458859 RepID=UPI0004F6B78D|nr:exonuclease recombination-associated [Shewanella sp. phage 1/4]AHK11169.1 RdgC-like exonuclease [Shewanella sp. phage 1/4]
MKSVVVYELKSPVVILADDLESSKFIECGAHDASRSGFSPTIEDGYVMDLAGDVKVLNYTTQVKVPNKAEVKRQIKAKVSAYKDQFGGEPNENELAEFEAQIKEGLLPLTPANEPKTVTVLVSPTKVYVEGNYKQAEVILDHLRNILGSLPVELLNLSKPLTVTLTAMVKDELNTDLFVLGDKVTYVNADELKVSQTSGSVYNSDAVQHTADGATVTSLQLEYSGLTMFTLKADMSISGIKFAKDLTAEVESGDEVGTVTIQVKEVINLVDDLIEELGGVI